MASLAARLSILLRKKRPQPVLIIPVSFLNTRSGSPVALVARRAAEFLGVMNLEQVGIRMAHERLSVLIRVLGAFGCERSGSEFQRLESSHVAGLAKVDNVGLGGVALDLF